MYVHLCMTHIQTDIFTNMGTNTFIFTSAQAHVRHSCAHAYIKHTLFYNTWLHKLTYMHTCTQEAGSLPPSWLVDVKLFNRGHLGRGGQAPLWSLPQSLG